MRTCVDSDARVLHWQSLGAVAYRVRAGRYNPFRSAPGREGRPGGLDVRRFLRDESGQGLVEYALIVFLIAVVVIAILLLLGPQIANIFNSIYQTI